MVNELTSRDLFFGRIKVFNGNAFLLSGSNFDF
jgi:hypothetical protein